MFVNRAAVVRDVITSSLAMPGAPKSCERCGRSTLDPEFCHRCGKALCFVCWDAYEVCSDHAVPPSPAQAQDSIDFEQTTNPREGWIV